MVYFLIKIVFQTRNNLHNILCFFNFLAFDFKIIYESNMYSPNSKNLLKLVSKDTNFESDD